jgi:hypothetical protein
VIFCAIFLLHISLVRLPYFWDEAGYYVPAARDIFLSGSFIPYSTPSNAHPPLVMSYLALSWKIAGYAPLVTRTAMLLLAAFSLTGLFRLAERVANTEVAVATTVSSVLYPVCFAQASLAHVDLASAGLLFWGLEAYFAARPRAMTGWFALAVLAKETAILAPLALYAWELVASRLAGRSGRGYALLPGSRRLYLLIPLLPLGLWYGYHFLHTGFVFGNPEFFRYNVQQTTEPLRILLALLLRTWQVTGYMGLSLLTLATLLAMTRPPLIDEEADGALKERARIAPSRQFAFLAITSAYVAAMSVVGGAVLARYMLPVVPLWILTCVSTVHRRVRGWHWVLVLVILGFIEALLVNPHYGFSLEDNLAYRDYVVLHQGVASFLERRYPQRRVLTAWPANDELTRPYLGYVTRPIEVLRVENFTVDELLSASDLGSNFSLALVFSTKYIPPHPWFDRWQKWREWKTRFFGYHRDAPPELAAGILKGHLVYLGRRQGQWVGVVQLDRIEDARRQPGFPVTEVPRQVSLLSRAALARAANEARGRAKP